VCDVNVFQPTVWSSLQHTALTVEADNIQ